VRIGFNARTLAAPQIRAWTRYVVQLLRHLPELGAELVLLSDQPLNCEYLAQLVPGSFRVVPSPAMRDLVWEQDCLPLACARGREGLLHASVNDGRPALAHCSRALTRHDAIDAALEFLAKTPMNQGLWSLSGKELLRMHRKALVARASEHAKHFSWQGTAQLTYDSHPPCRW